MTIIKNSLLFLFLIGFVSCNYNDVPIDPCEMLMPPVSGTNVIVFKDTNRDTLQIIDFENVDRPVEVRGVSNETAKVTINIYYNKTYLDSDLNQSELLFNGALGFQILIEYEMDSVNANQYEMKYAHISFDDGYFSTYYFENTEYAESNITKLGEKINDKIDGFFKAKFVNSNNQTDTLLIDFEFSAVRRCY